VHGFRADEQYEGRQKKISGYFGDGSSRAAQQNAMLKMTMDALNEEVIA
jgi:hypothetical protein